MTGDLASRTHTTIPSPIGELMLVAQDGDLVRVCMSPLPEADPATVGRRRESGFTAAARQLREYFERRREVFELPLRLEPTDDKAGFMHRVWAVLRQIPYGQTRTYGDLAREFGDPGLAQAVGMAAARNPLPIVIPCHRVIGTNGSLTGFAGGLERKRFLLGLEEPDALTAGRLF